MREALEERPQPDLPFGTGQRRSEAEVPAPGEGQVLTRIVTFDVEAIRIATMRGLTVHVFEEGYLRPNWVTLEQGGVNNNSAMLRDPDWFLSQAAHLPAWKDRMSPHVLRHYCASQLYLSGVNLISIQEMYGHAWVTTTMRYVHVHRSRIEDAWLAGQRRAAARLEGLT